MSEEPAEQSEPALSSDEIADLLRRARMVIFRHPLASQAAFSALVAEGRAYAETEAGATLKRELSASPSARRLRTVWDIATMNALREKPDALMPTAVIEACSRLLVERHLEERLSHVFESVELKVSMAERATDEDG